MQKNKYNTQNRSDIIIKIISKKHKIGISEIIMELSKEAGKKIPRITVNRDIEKLILSNLIIRKGKGPSVYYELSLFFNLLKKIDIQEYFKKEPDNRDVKERFNFEIFNCFSNSLFLKNELSELDKLNDDYKKRIKKLSPTILKKEFERLTIELSWKSSQIEGNTYSLIDTEILIKENKPAKNHTKEETQMILNHKKTLDYIFSNRNNFKKLTLAKIEDIHKMLIEKMAIKNNIRKSLVGITGTKYQPLDNEFQIREAIEKLIDIVNKKENHPLLKAFVSVLLISYIQPFEDGNKRTARLLGNAILFANNYCPLSYRSVNDNDYKKAMILFYEQNNAKFFKELFIDQFIFSLNNYFLIHY